jgi:hypothetical protein
MTLRLRRGGPLRIAVLAACTMTTGAAYAATAPSAATPGVSMAAVKARVAYGSTVRISGSVAGRAPGRAVRLEWAPRGGGFRTAARTRSGAGGLYRFAVRARRSGAYRAVSELGEATGGRRVTVVARLTGSARHHFRRGARVGVRGVLSPRLRGRGVRLQVRTRHGWRTVDRVRTRGGGRFRAAWRPPRPGRYRLRIRFAGDRLNAAVSRQLRGRVYVYRPGKASWYGPGLYGHRTACGQTLNGGIKGVAHKWLPCGTRITFRYRGRSVSARVIDRGPFSAGRDWDLTPAVKRALRFGDVGVVWSTR